MWSIKKNWLENRMFELNSAAINGKFWIYYNIIWLELNQNPNMNWIFLKAHLFEVQLLVRIVKSLIIKILNLYTILYVLTFITFFRYLSIPCNAFITACYPNKLQDIYCMKHPSLLWSIPAISCSVLIDIISNLKSNKIRIKITHLM